MKPEIVNFPETLIACLEHRGSPTQVVNSALAFVEWRKTSGEAPAGTSQLYGIPYGDSESGAPEDFRHDICATIENPVSPNDHGVITKTIPAGRCAKLRHIGSPSALTPSIDALYKDWLPTSGETRRSFPCYLHFVNQTPAVSDAEQITDIYLPIK